MADVDVSGGGGRRRSLDSQINMIPMIDLLMVTISFLLITAVWTHMSRIDADARVPGKNDEPARPVVMEKELHVTQAPDKFVLAWKEGNVTVESIDVPRTETVLRKGSVEVVRFPELAARIESEWKAKGQHTNPDDERVDRAVVHTDDGTEFRYIVALLDALYETHRDMRVGRKLEKVPAFNVAFATN